jgi:predicted nucleic acid-binding protein
MTVLDSSVIMYMLAGDEAVTDAVNDRGQPFVTSPICVYEVIEGQLGASETDIAAERQRFGGVQTVDFSEAVALEACRLQDDCYAVGEPLAARDALVAGTASVTGDELVATDTDFDSDPLRDHVDITVLHPAA